MSYFLDPNGRRIRFKDIAAAIRTLHPNLVGAHIFPQLNILGLREAFDNGESPVGLPFSFSDYDDDDTLNVGDLHESGSLPGSGAGAEGRA